MSLSPNKLKFVDLVGYYEEYSTHGVSNLLIANFAGTHLIFRCTNITFCILVQSELDSGGSLLSHPNVVRLLGYCAEDNTRFFVVYEYMQKGTLENHLFKGMTQHEKAAS